MPRNALGESILADLTAVQTLRDAREAKPELLERVQALKDYQARRLKRTYADLLQDSRQGMATRFFLDDLYGPGDFRSRDTQFARIVPAMKRLLPSEVLEVIARVTALHLLSEQLDDQLAAAIALPDISARNYQAAWLKVNVHSTRRRQLDEVLWVGRELDRLTRQPLLRQTVRWMRRPAQAAGLSELHVFLERGLFSFAALGGAGEFLTTIQQRESMLLDALGRDPSHKAAATASEPRGDSALMWLP